MDYKEKLKKWNSTDKYKKELEFLYSLINPKEGYKVLDFGCGIMTAIERFNSAGIGHFYGYDIQEYGEQSQYHLYDKTINKKYDCIYFMHSIAHIENPVECLKKLSDNITDIGKVIVITPNKDWLDVGYNNDTTVIRHYSTSDLKEIAKEAGYKVNTIGQFGEIRRYSHERLFCILQKSTI